MKQLIYFGLAWLLSGVLTLFFFRLRSTRRCENDLERFVMSAPILTTIQVVYWPYAIYLFIAQF